jgi:hypothetical protein
MNLGLRRCVAVVAKNSQSCIWEIKRFAVFGDVIPSFVNENWWVETPMLLKIFGIVISNDQIAYEGIGKFPIP